MNRPVFKVISDDAILLDIARNLPEKDVDLAGLGLSPKQIRLWGGEILEAVKRGTVAPLVKREQTKRPSDADAQAAGKAQELEEESCPGHGRGVRYCPAKVYLNSLAENPPKSLQELESIMHDSPTRFNRYGEQILSPCGRLRMRINFHGAAHTVTGSQHLLEINGHRLLLDCGLYQGRRAETYARNLNFAYDPRNVDAVILSHAHIDHCGNLPNLVKNGL